MTVEWLDSAYPPNDAQIAAAKTAGYGGWAGYFAGLNILNGWAKSDFDRVKAGGLRTMAYCSGWSDPAVLKAQGEAWAVTICLDDESGIRPTGGWEQSWLNVAGSGIYGNYWLHGVTAAFHILAAYPTSGDPGNTDWWGSTPRPAGLTGWQWAGTHGFAGISVDSSWFDEGVAVLGFSGGGGSIGGDMTQTDWQSFHDAIQFEAWGSVDASPQSLADFMYAIQHGTSAASILAGWKASAAGAAWQAELAKATAPPPPPEPMLNFHYTFAWAHWTGDGPQPDPPQPVNETTTLANAVAFAKQYETDHPGIVVSIDVAEFTP